MKYHIETFGCQMNESDSRLIGLMLEESGYLKAGNAKEADLIIVNTCCVRENAEKRINGFLGSLKHCKKANSAIIAVCGCMTQKPGAALELAAKVKHIDIIIGTFALTKLPQYVEEARFSKDVIIDVEENYANPDIAFSRMDISKLEVSYKAQVSIIYGCNNFCTYCIVPYVRGRERSRQPELIIEEIKALVGKGCKEIQLLGQNVNSYGKDLGQKLSFARLLREISKIGGLERIRFMTSHPRDFDLELLDTISDNPKICKHFHLPVQSGSAKILKLMNRGYTPEDYQNKLELIRKKCPDAAITSDLIVGFPNETEADFEETLGFMQAVRIDSAYTFLYSRRSNTPAAEMENQVPEDEKSRRLQVLNKVQNPISLANNQKYLKRSLLVLAEGESKNNPNYYSGRSEQNKVVVFENTRDIKAGEFVKLKITEAKTWNLSGDLTD